MHISPCQDETSLMRLLEAVPPLCAHDEFVSNMLDALKHVVPNDMLSYNEFPQVDSHSIATWDITEFLDASIVVWTPAGCTGGLSVEDQRLLAMRYLHEHPSMKRGTRTIFRNSDLVERTAWQRTSLYNELHRPLGLGAQGMVLLPAQPGRVVALAYSRERDDFADHELQELRRIQRILGRSIRDHWRYLELVGECARWRQMSDAEERGVVFVTGNGTIDWASRRARAWLAGYGLAAVHGALPAPLADWLQPILDGRAAAIPPFSRQSGAAILTVMHLPGQGGAKAHKLAISKGDWNHMHPIMLMVKMKNNPEARWKSMTVGFLNHTWEEYQGPRPASRTFLAFYMGGDMAQKPRIFPIEAGQSKFLRKKIHDNKEHFEKENGIWKSGFENGALDAKAIRMPGK